MKNLKFIASMVVLGAIISPDISAAEPKKVELSNPPQLKRPTVKKDREVLGTVPSENTQPEHMQREEAPEPMQAAQSEIEPFSDPEE